MLILIIVHILCLSLILAGKISGRLYAGRSMLIIAALVPVFGPLCVISTEFRVRDTGENTEIIDLNRMKIEDEIYRSITVNPDDDAKGVVPVEESLLINDPVKRRKLLLNVLSLDSSQYVPSLRRAGKNDDTEVVHYAVTGLVELRKDYADRLQRMEQELKHSDNTSEALQKSIKLEEEYIASELPEKGELKEHIIAYDKLLSRALDESESTGEKARILHKRAECAISLRDYEHACKIIDRLIVMEPEKEESYLMKLRCFGALKNRKGIDGVLQMLESNHVFLSEKGKEAVAFWQPDGV